LNTFPCLFPTGPERLCETTATHRAWIVHSTTGAPTVAELCGEHADTAPRPDLDDVQEVARAACDDDVTPVLVAHWMADLIDAWPTAVPIDDMCRAHDDDNGLTPRAHAEQRMRDAIAADGFTFLVIPALPFQRCRTCNGIAEQTFLTFTKVDADPTAITSACDPHTGDVMNALAAEQFAAADAEQPAAAAGHDTNGVTS
jgi:hypothetical protein